MFDRLIDDQEFRGGRIKAQECFDRIEQDVPATIRWYRYGKCLRLDHTGALNRHSGAI
jgi:hypothetical protein